MFPEPVLIFWLAVDGVTLAYLALFAFACRPVALRLRRLAWAALAVAVLRLGLLALGVPVRTYMDGWLIVTAGLLTLALGATGPVLVVRVSAEVLREQIKEGCRRLFLNCEEASPGRFLLTAKDGTRELRVVERRGVRWLVLPAAGGPRKVDLLVHWLHKQYPGPIPRIRIVLKKE